MTNPTDSADSTLPSRDTIMEKLLVAFVKVTGREQGSVSLAESTKLRDDLGLDSFAAIELIFELEDMVGVRIPQDAASSFQTVGDVVSYVIAQMSVAQTSSVEPQGGTGAP
jgi:acyl carrier protein